jgi:hypothetical protein
MIPDDKDTFSDADILAVADDAIALKIVPALLSTGNDYLLTYIDYPTPTTSYSIPNRAVGLKIKDVTLVNGQIEEPLPQVDDLLDRYTPGYFIRGNSICFHTAPDRTVRIYYHLKPSSLTALTNCSIIQSISSADIVVDVVPDAVTGADNVDFVKSSPDFSVVQMDKGISSISGTTITMDAVPSAEVVAGMFICNAGTSPVIAVPTDLYGSLEWFCASEVLDSQGDFNGAERAKNRAEGGLSAGVRLLDPRVDGVLTRKIINRNSELRNDARSKIKGSWSLR